MPTYNEKMIRGRGIIGPDAEYLVNPEFRTKTILYKDFDLKRINESSMVMDTDGHYSRPDIFSLTVNEAPMENVRFIH